MLLVLLSFSLLAHVVLVCRGSVVAHFPKRREYSYVPLNNINGVPSRDGKGGDRLEDSDSQDEIWSPQHS